MRKEIFRCRVGSHLYGLNTPNSDEDFISVFMPETKDILGLQKVDQINNSTKSSSEDRRNTKEDVDDVSYSLPKFCHLVLQNNPNIVELLFTDEENTLVCEPEFQILRDNYEKLISTRVFHTFTGYAFSQKKKLTVKKERYTALIESIESLEKRFGSLLKDPKSKIVEFEVDWMNNSLSYYKSSKGNCNSFHNGMSLKPIYEKLVEERNNYGWRVKTESFEKLGYDVKFAYHLIRILAEGTQLLKTGKLSFPLNKVDKIIIMSIRNQEVPYEDLLKLYDLYDAKAREAYENTTLRKKPDWKWANEHLVRTLTEHITNSEVTRFLNKTLKEKG